MPEKLNESSWIRNRSKFVQWLFELFLQRPADGYGARGWMCDEACLEAADVCRYPNENDSNREASSGARLAKR